MVTDSESGGYPPLSLSVTMIIQCLASHVNKHRIILSNISALVKKGEGARRVPSPGGVTW